MQFRKRSRVSYVKGMYPTLTECALLGHISRNIFSINGCLKEKEIQDDHCTL